MLNPSEFYKKADAMVGGSKKTTFVEAFGSVDKKDDSVDTDFLEEDDFDFDEDEEAAEQLKPEDSSDDFEDDFDDFDDFDDLETQDSNEQVELSASEDVSSASEFDSSNLGIQSVEIPACVKENEVGSGSIEEEIVKFLVDHKFSVSNTDHLFVDWNKAFNDMMCSNEEMFIRFLQVKYSLWFTDVEIANAAIAEGMDFIRNLKMHRRICQKGDISFISRVWKEPWYSNEIIDRYSNDVNFNPQLFELMKQGKVDTEIMDRYVSNSVALLCCIRLLLADKYEYSGFESALNKGEIEQYTNAMLDNDVDRFVCIRDRSDFQQLLAMITNIEKSGLIVDQDVLEKYCDYYYLSTIIKANALGFLNEEFVQLYLKDDLGNLEYIAKIYEENNVDLKLSKGSVNFFEAKIRTDLRVFGLKDDKFDYELFPIAFQCLINSRYGGELSIECYKKFLAVVVYSVGDRVLSTLNTQKTLIGSFNEFWLGILLEDLGLNTKVYLNSDFSDCVIVFDTNKVRNWVVLQIDHYALDPDAFKEAIGDVYYAQVHANKYLMISGQELFDFKRVRYNFDLQSSITTWANNEIDIDIINQFSEHRPIIHANLLKMLYVANEKFEEERVKSGAPKTDANYQISKSVLKFLEMNIIKYSRYDKMMYYVSNSAIFIHLLRSRHAKEFLMFFSNAYTYDNNAKMAYMLLHCIFLNYYSDKYTLANDKISNLNDKNIMFINGMGEKQACHNLRTLIKSIDNLFSVAQQSNHITLDINQGSILLTL